MQIVPFLIKTFVGSNQAIEDWIMAHGNTQGRAEYV
jgi:hypothetical protein